MSSPLPISNTADLNRKGFGLKQAITPHMQRDYRSPLVDWLKANGHQLLAGGIELRLAKEFGFCYGVDRAVEYAYETREKFPERNLWITGEIIHNPFVNRRLKEMGIRFLDETPAGVAQVQADEVVLLPAFGVPAPFLESIRARKAVIVDTTCGSVLNVWKQVENNAKAGYTSIIHGKYGHEETRATASRAALFPGGKYLVVLNLEEAERVARFMEAGCPEGAEAEALAHDFTAACPPGFSFTVDLQRVGLANQTTMLSSESIAIAQRFEVAQQATHGGAMKEHFRAFDTICSATQDRQDAVQALLQWPPQLMVVIGGFNSSNTTHLKEMGDTVCPTFHVETAEGVLATEIRHKPLGEAPRLTAHWWPEGATRVAITAGASTPDLEVGRLAARLLEIRGAAPPVPA